MADQDLIEYCRRNLEEYSAEELRASLLSEGLDAALVDEALVAAARLGALGRPAPKPSAAAGLRWLFLFCCAIGLLFAGIWNYSARENKNRPPSTPQNQPVADPSSLASSGGAYLGHFGYLLKLPSGIAASEGLCRLDTQTETVLIHPADGPPINPADTNALLRGGGILLEISARNDPLRGWLGLAELRPLYVQAGSPRAALEDVPGLSFPALRARYGDGRVETVLEGKNTFYRFSALRPTPWYNALVAGLSESEPRDHMQGFLLVGANAAGKVYWHDATRTWITVPAGYSRVPPYTGRGIRYDFAYKSDSDPFEARIRFDPTAEEARQYRTAEQQGCAKQGSCPSNPDEPSDSWASAIAMNMTQAPFSFDLIPQRLAEEEFAADWGMLSPAFGLSQKNVFNYPYKFGVILHIHKNGLGNYHVIFMADSPQSLARHTNSSLIGAGVRFADYYQRAAKR